MAAAEAWARGHGLQNLTLHTGIFNTEARAFCAALGFAEEEVRLTRAVRPWALLRGADLAEQFPVRQARLIEQQLERVL
jgi:hypothetical protein